MEAFQVREDWKGAPSFLVEGLSAENLLTEAQRVMGTLTAVLPDGDEFERMVCAEPAILGAASALLQMVLRTRMQLINPDALREAVAITERRCPAPSPRADPGSPGGARAADANLAAQPPPTEDLLDEAKRKEAVKLKETLALAEHRPDAAAAAKAKPKSPAPGKGGQRPPIAKQGGRPASPGKGKAGKQAPAATGRGGSRTPPPAANRGPRPPARPPTNTQRGGGGSDWWVHARNR